MTFPMYETVIRHPAQYERTGQRSSNQKWSATFIPIYLQVTVKTILCTVAKKQSTETCMPSSTASRICCPSMEPSQSVLTSSNASAAERVRGTLPSCLLSRRKGYETAMESHYGRMLLSISLKSLPQLR